MMITLYLFLLSFLAISLLMFGVWLLQLKNKNAGIVDIVWAISFLVAALVYSFFTDGYALRHYVLLACVSLWCLRLGFHLFVRNWGKEEDLRYTQLRKDWGTKANRNLFFFFEFQAFTAAALSIPLIWILNNPALEFSILELIGYGLIVVAVLGEALADYQLQHYKKTAPKAGICDVGLWNYSRHPNYFFEWLVWVAIFLIALPLDYGWISIYCPILMWHFLNNVTGVKLTEEHMVKTRGERYLNYQRSTSAFIPWFKLVKRNER
jgi:steroid 5-alpha reductase family enzyme